MLESGVGGGGDVCFEQVSSGPAQGTVCFVTSGEHGPRRGGGRFPGLGTEWEISK